MIEDLRSHLEHSAIPDVFLDQFVVFHRPEVLITELTVFNTPPAGRKGAFREWVESLAFTIVFVLIFTSYVAQATQVPTESMRAGCCRRSVAGGAKVTPFPAATSSTIRSGSIRAVS